MARQIIHTDDAPAAVGTYSQAIKIGNTVYISGQLGLDPKTMQLKEGFTAQAEQAFDNLAAIAKAAGGTLDDVVKFNVSLTDLNDFGALNEVFDARLSAPTLLVRQYKLLLCPKVVRLRLKPFCI